MASRRPKQPSRATVDDVHAVAAALPGVERTDGPLGNAIYQVRGKSFVFFRNPRPDAVDEQTGERLTDVIVIWVPDDDDKRALVDDPATPWFTTPHFKGHPSVLVRASRLHELTRSAVEEAVTDAWRSRAPKRLVQQWLAEQ